MTAHANHDRELRTPARRLELGEVSLSYDLRSDAASPRRGGGGFEAEAAGVQKPDPGAPMARDGSIEKHQKLSGNALRMDA